MPRFIIKADRERDAYIERSTIVDAPCRVGCRADFADEFGEDRLARTDAAGTSARWYEWLPPARHEGGWDGPSLIYLQSGLLPRTRLGDLFDLLDSDVNADVPPEWLLPFDDDEGVSDA